MVTALPSRVASFATQSWLRLTPSAFASAVKAACIDFGRRRTNRPLASGGGYRHGQVIGATDHRGGEIKERRVVPADLAATVFRHLRIPLDAAWTSLQGRPIPVVTGGGRPIGELG